MEEALQGKKGHRVQSEFLDSEVMGKCVMRQGGLGLEWRSCPKTFLLCDCGQAPYCADHSAQLQVTSGYTRTPSALPLQPVTPAPLLLAPGSPGPVATSALLCPALPPAGVCVCTRRCTHTLGCVGSTETLPCLCSNHTPLQTTWTRWVASLFLLGGAHFYFDRMAMFSMGNR